MSKLRFSDEARIDARLEVPSGRHRRRRPDDHQRAACRGRSTTAILGDISIRFYPAGIQLYAMLFGVLAAHPRRAAAAAARRG